VGTGSGAAVVSLSSEELGGAEELVSGVDSEASSGFAPKRLARNCQCPFFSGSVINGGSSVSLGRSRSLSDAAREGLFSAIGWFTRSFDAAWSARCRKLRSHGLPGSIALAEFSGKPTQRSRSDRRLSKISGPLEHPRKGARQTARMPDSNVKVRKLGVLAISRRSCRWKRKCLFSESCRFDEFSCPENTQRLRPRSTTELRPRKLDPRWIGSRAGDCP